MTRQDAIDILVGVITTNSEEENEALDMAIEALEQETVSRETYDDEFNLRKEFEMKVFELEKKIAEQEPICCKDCKYWHEWENGTGDCSRSNSIWVGTDFDDYCSFAEQKESDEE